MNAADINQPPDYAGRAKALQWRVGTTRGGWRTVTGTSGSAPVGWLPGGGLPCLSNSTLFPSPAMTHLCLHVSVSFNDSLDWYGVPTLCQRTPFLECAPTAGVARPFPKHS